MGGFCFPFLLPAGLRLRVPCEVELGILPENRPLQFPQRAAGLDPKVDDERLSGVLIGRERLGLAAGAVEGEHQLASQAFT